MKGLVSKLNKFVDGAEARVKLTKTEEKIFRSLRTQGERAIKGRSISRCIFEAHAGEDGALLMMAVEGRYSLSVGNQIVRRFAGMPEVGSVVAKRTDTGARIIIRLA